MYVRTIHVYVYDGIYKVGICMYSTKIDAVLPHCATPIEENVFRRNARGENGSDEGTPIVKKAECCLLIIFSPQTRF